jgi:lipopolysaccharide transport system permease protein
MNKLIRQQERPVSSYTETFKRDHSSGRKNYLYLILVMAITDFKVKYDNSALGYLWSLLKPLLMFGTLYLVFSVFVRWNVENYKLYLLLGIILWNFLSEVTLNSMVLLEGKASIIKKIYFPRWIIVIASSLTSLLTLLLNIIVFFLFFIFSDTPFHASAFLLVLYLVELYLLSVGLALLLCAMYPKFRDIHHIWEVFVQLGFWVTPIIYPVSIVPEKYHTIIFMNPMARIIQGSRQAIIGPPGDLVGCANHLIIISAAAVLFLAGLTLFNKLSRSFAEDL